MKSNYSFQFIDLRFRENSNFEQYRGATNNARLFMIMIRHKKIETISDGKKFSEVNVT